MKDIVDTWESTGGGGGESDRSNNSDNVSSDRNDDIDAIMIMTLIMIEYHINGTVIDRNDNDENNAENKLECH